MESKAKARTSADHTADLSVPGDLESSPGSPAVHAVTPHALSPQANSPPGCGTQGCALHIHSSRPCLSPSPSPAPCCHLSKAKPTYCSHRHLRAGTPNTCPPPESNKSLILSVQHHPWKPPSPSTSTLPLVSQEPPRGLPWPSGYPHGPTHRSPDQSQPFTPL